MNRCYDQHRNRYYNCNSTWSNWGRWVLFAVIVIALILIFFLFSCLTTRRRRKRGLQPFYGTGWVGNTPPGHGAATYNPQYQNPNPEQNLQQPQYGYGNQQGQAGGQNQTQGGYGANQGYYGGQQTGATELQQPPNAYRGGEQVFSPPAGPPPGKDGVVR